MLRALMLPMVLALAISRPAGAVVLLFSDFESVQSSDFARRGYAVFGAAGGWQGGAAGIEVQSRGVAGRAFSGQNLVELDSTRNSSMWLDLPRGRYTVSYWYSPRPNVGDDSNIIALSWHDSLGGAELDRVSGDGGRQTLWQRREVTFRGEGGRLSFAAAGRSDSLGGYLDDITITRAAVPELSTWVMLIAGFGMVGMAARRRQRGVAA
jgi:hypothetical protein